MAEKIDRLAIFDEAKKRLTPWSTEDGRLFVDYQSDKGRRTIHVQPSGNCDFRGWFASFCVNVHGFVPNGDFLSTAQIYFSDWIRTEGTKLPDFIRVGGTVTDMYLDIGDSSNDAWRINAKGIERVGGGPNHIRTLRGGGMLGLVEPDFSAKAADLTPLLRNFIKASDDDMTLLVAWLLGVMRPEGPYPVLTISGEQGSGKSTILRLLRRIIDPHALDMRTPPEDQRDLQAMVRNSFILAFDNVSYISNKMSDALCVISTGTGAQGARALYTNAEESAVRVCRPIAMNGIPDVIERGDLVDRSIHVHLPRIDPKDRRDDSEFWTLFKSLHAKLLGALMDAAYVAMTNYHTVVLEEKPRMSAFAVWVVAAEQALGWEVGKFMQVYSNNRSAAELQMLEFHGLASALMRLMEERKEFSGTYSDLIGALEMHSGPRETLPRTSHGFAAELRRIKPLLERKGLAFFNGGRSGAYGQKGRSRLQIVRTEKFDA